MGRNTQNKTHLNMNGFVLSALAVAALANVASATIVIGTATATAGTATTISSASAASLGLLGGVILLKGLVLGAALLSRRGKRSAENDYAFIALNNPEPAQCYRRLICDLATAAEVGKIVKNAGVCEVRYSCPLSTQEIAKLF